MDATDIRREDCRFAVLQALDARAAGAHEASTLRTVYMRGTNFTQAEVDEALALLASAKLVDKIERPAPAFGYAWQITLEGSRAYAQR